MVLFLLYTDFTKNQFGFYMFYSRVNEKNDPAWKSRGIAAPEREKKETAGSSGSLLRETDYSPFAAAFAAASRLLIFFWL